MVTALLRRVKRNLFGGEGGDIGECDLGKKIRKGVNSVKEI